MRSVLSILSLLIILLSMGFSCENEEVLYAPCDYTATVIDTGDLEGGGPCGFVLQANDSTRYLPVWRWGLYCGTPPLPKEITEDPLYNFKFYHGQKVTFSYDPFDGGTICMTGIPIVLTCLKELENSGRAD